MSNTQELTVRQAKKMLARPRVGKDEFLYVAEHLDHRLRGAKKVLDEVYKRLKKNPPTYAERTARELGVPVPQGV